MNPLERALLSLDGLSVGDAFGERFFVPDARSRIAERRVAAGRWTTTDDTEMAEALVEVLARFGRVEQDELAYALAVRWQRDPRRGYGAFAAEILEAVTRGASWRVASAAPFGGSGSMGNGGAMRVAPLGAWFADDLDRVVVEARYSAEVTHHHPEGRAGAIAVAVAAAVAWRERADLARARKLLFEEAIERLSLGPTRAGVVAARDLPATTAPDEAARLLGSGERVISVDTVPFALWCAARHLGDYQEALWATVAGLGDRDTTCAIVGGIVALSAAHESIPRAWLEAREPLRLAVG